MIEQKTNETEVRERVLKHAFLAFVQRGVKSVRMDDLSSELGMSKRTLYEMFTDKEHLLLECLRYNDQQSKKEIADLTADSDNPLKVYVKVLNKRLEELQQVNIAFISESKHYPIVQEFIRQGHNKREENLLHFTQACIEAGVFRTDVEYRLLVKLFDMMANSIMEQELYKLYPMQTIVKTLNTTFLTGLCTPKGLEILKNNNRGNSESNAEPRLSIAES